MMQNVLRSKTKFILMFILGVSLCQGQTQYPLHVGDRWQYVDLGFADTSIHIYGNRVIEAETLMQNGYTYFASNWGFFGSPFERSSGSRVYIYNASMNEDQLVLDFEKTAGDTIASYPWNGDTTDIILEYSNPGVWQFYVDRMRNVFDDESWCIITDSLGVTQEWGIFYHAYLSAALIDGKTHGTFLGVDTKVGLPTSISISQNYPNPFNPSTSLNISISRSTHLNIAVFNLVGLQVDRIVSDFFSPGEYGFSWTPGEVSGGVYYFRIQTDDRTFVQKALYLR